MPLLTKKQIGKGLRRCREQFLKRPRYQAAAIANIHDDILRKREAGATHVMVADVVSYANAWGVEPVAFFAELIHQCDQDHWEKVAAQLDCTVPMAKRRLKLAQEKHRMNFGQVWALYLQEQIKL